MMYVFSISPGLHEGLSLTLGMIEYLVAICIIWCSVLGVDRTLDGVVLPRIGLELCARGGESLHRVRHDDVRLYIRSHRTLLGQ